MKKSPPLLFILFLFLWTTCREVDSIFPNHEPLARAGNDVTINKGTPVTLDGSASSDADGDALSFTWEFLTRPSGSQSALLPFDSARSVFTPDLPGEYVIRLVVSDNIGTASDTLEVIALQVNHSPIANAGPDMSIALGVKASLDGSVSSDPDGDPLTYSWTFISKPSGSQVQLIQSDSVKSSFAPDQTGKYRIRLMVSDGQSSDADTVEVNGVQGNSRPVAKAGNNIATTVGVVTNLDGSKSFDPDGDPLTYSWTFLTRPAGSQSNLSSSSIANPNFTPDKAGLYRIRLSVSDTQISHADTVDVSAVPGNAPPVAAAGADGSADLGSNYSLTGSGTDPNNDQLTFSWTLINKPAGSAATIQNPTSQNASILIDKHGSYTTRLTVSDGSLTDTDDAVITTNNVNVTGINPTSGPFGITVKIAGKNFSNVAGENTVMFNGMAAVVTSASYTNVDATVPKGAGTGIVSVSTNGITDSGPVFTYILTAVVSTVAQFDSPFNMVTDANGNVYISDYNSHVIRRLTPQGQLSIIAGSGKAGYLDDKSPNAMFNRPAGLALDAVNNFLYVADNSNHCIRRISLSSNVVTTLAGFPQAGFNDGMGGQAQFSSPIGLGIDSQGNLYVGDTGNSRLRKVTPAGMVSTFAGSGQPGFAEGKGSLAQFNGIAGVTVDNNGNIYVADGLNHRIRKVDQQTVVSTLAGNGTPDFVNGSATAARFNTPYGVACDASGNVYVADFSNHSIRRVTTTGNVSTVAGNGTAGFAEGNGASARFNQPTGLWVAGNGNIHVADFQNQRVRLIVFE